MSYLLPRSVFICTQGWVRVYIYIYTRNIYSLGRLQDQWVEIIVRITKCWSFGSMFGANRPNFDVLMSHAVPEVASCMLESRFLHFLCVKK